MSDREKAQNLNDDAIAMELFEADVEYQPPDDDDGPSTDDPQRNPTKRPRLQLIEEEDESDLNLLEEVPAAQKPEDPKPPRRRRKRNQQPKKSGKGARGKKRRRGKKNHDESSGSDVEADNEEGDTSDTASDAGNAELFASGDDEANRREPTKRSKIGRPTETAANVAACIESLRKKALVKANDPSLRPKKTKSKQQEREAEEERQQRQQRLDALADKSIDEIEKEMIDVVTKHFAKGREDLRKLVLTSEQGDEQRRVLHDSRQRVIAGLAERIGKYSMRESIREEEIRKLRDELEKETRTFW